MTTSDCNCPVDDSWVKVSLFPSLYFLFVDPLLLYFVVVVFLLTITECTCLHQEEANQPRRRPPSPVPGQTTSQQLNMPPFVVIHLSGPTPLLRLSILIILNAFTLLVIPTTKTRHWPPKSNHSRVTLSGGKSYIIISRVPWCLCPKWRRFGFNLSSD